MGEGFNGNEGFSTLKQINTAPAEGSPKGSSCTSVALPVLLGSAVPTGIVAAAAADALAVDIVVVAGVLDFSVATDL